MCPFFNKTLNQERADSPWYFLFYLDKNIAVKSQIIISSLEDTSLISPVSLLKMDSSKWSLNLKRSTLMEKNLTNQSSTIWLSSSNSVKFQVQHPKNIRNDKKSKFTSIKFIHFACKLTFSNIHSSINWLVS